MLTIGIPTRTGHTASALLAGAVRLTGFRTGLTRRFIGLGSAGLSLASGSRRRVVTVRHDIGVEDDLIDQILDRKTTGERFEDRPAQLRIEDRPHHGDKTCCRQQRADRPQPPAPAALWRGRREGLG